METSEIQRIEAGVANLATHLSEALGYLRAARLVRSDEERTRLVQAAAAQTKRVADAIHLLPFPDTGSTIRAGHN